MPRRETPDGQFLLDIGRPNCARCIHEATGRCRGPTNIASLHDLHAESIGCSDLSLQLRHREGLSSRLPRRTLAPPSVPPLPAFIPLLKAAMPTDCPPPSGRLYAVSMTSLLDEGGMVRYASPSSLRAALQLGDDAVLLGLAIARDRRIEPFDGRNPSESWDRLGRLGFSVMTGSTYSVCDAQPRAEQIHNQDRNYASFERLSGMSIPTIPFLFAAASEDYEVASRWLEDRPSITTVAVSAQQFKTRQQFQAFLRHFAQLREIVPRPLQYLVVGCASQERIRRVLDETAAVAFVTGLPVHSALSGLKVTEELRYLRVSQPFSYHELLIHNLAVYERLIRVWQEDVKSRVAQDSRNAASHRVG